VSELRYGPEVEVKFNPPDPTVIRLQGPALRAYEQWLEDPSWDNEEALTDAIYEQCEHHVLMWSTVNEWSEID
jgi:hypothetical protein